EARGALRAVGRSREDARRRARETVRGGAAAGERRACHQADARFRSRLGGRGKGERGKGEGERGKGEVSPSPGQRAAVPSTDRGAGNTSTACNRAPRETRGTSSASAAPALATT